MEVPPPRYSAGKGGSEVPGSGVFIDPKQDPVSCRGAPSISIHTCPQPQPMNAILPGQVRWKTDSVVLFKEHACKKPSVII